MLFFSSIFFILNLSCGKTTSSISSFVSWILFQIKLGLSGEDSGNNKTLCHWSCLTFAFNTIFGLVGFATGPKKAPGVPGGSGAPGGGGGGGGPPGPPGGGGGGGIAPAFGAVGTTFPPSDIFSSKSLILFSNSSLIFETEEWTFVSSFNLFSNSVIFSFFISPPSPPKSLCLFFNLSYSSSKFEYFSDIICESLSISSLIIWSHFTAPLWSIETLSFKLLSISSFGLLGYIHKIHFSL